MPWPFRKNKSKGKGAVNQRQSHRENVRRELRSESTPAGHWESVPVLDDRGELMGKRVWIRNE